MDYGSLDVTLNFDACQTQSCVVISIVDDFEAEPVENFFYTLKTTPGLHRDIFLDPVIGEVEIIDNDDG